MPHPNKKIYRDDAERQQAYRDRKKVRDLIEDNAFAYTGRHWVETYVVGEPHPYLLEKYPIVKVIPPEWQRIVDWAIYFELEGKPFVQTKAQAEWIRNFLAHQFALLNAPRGHGKTHIATYLLPIYYVCEYPNISVLVLSASKDLAGDYSDAIRATFEQNEKLRAFYGAFDIGVDAKGEVHRATKWSTQQWIVPQRELVRKEPTLQVAGVGSKIIGKHPDLIVSDDLIQMEDEWSTAQGRKLEKWFKTVVKPMTTPELFGSGGEGSESRIWVLGTRKAPNDIYQAIKDMQIFYCKSYKAITQMPESYDYVYDKHNVLVGVENIKGDYEILMPEVWSIEDLLKEIQAIGKRIFASEYQNEPVPEQGLRFKWDDLRYWVTLPEKIEIYQWLDSALTEKEQRKRGSWSVLLTLGVHENQFYIIDIERGRWGVQGNFDAMQNGYEKYQPWYQGTEAVMFQSLIAQRLIEQTTLPIVTREQEHLKQRDKISRLTALDVHFENHRIHINPNLKEFENFKIEMLGFPQYETNDILDALEGAIWLYHFKRPKEPAFLFDI